LEIGAEWVYRMDSVYLAGGGVPPDTFLYQVRHSIVAIYNDNEGNDAYRVEVSYRTDSLDIWHFSRNYSLTQKNESIIRTDFDKAEIIAALPVKDEKVWNGNALNVDGSSDFYYLDSHTPGTYGPTTFDSTITIYQEERLNLIESYKGKEVYAANSGLVYREKERLKDIQDPYKTTGYTYTLTLISFEKK
jgi:hypothetical protein